MRLIVFTLLIIVGVSVTGPSEAQSAEPSKTQPKKVAQRSPLIGFTPLPYDFTVEARDSTYEFIRKNANIIAHHFDAGVPWPEAFEGRQFPEHLRNDWAVRKRNTPRHLKTFLAVTPINWVRTGLAPYWGSAESQPLPEFWASKRFSDPEVRQAYLRYVLIAIRYFRPDYVAIGIESNILISHAPELWPDYLRLHAYVYREVKRRHPRLPVFASVQYEHLRGVIPDSVPNHPLQARAVRALMRYSDYLGLSIYQPTSLQNVYDRNFFAPALRFRKPIVIAESGANSAPINLFGETFPATLVDQRRFVDTMLRNARRYRFPFVINFVPIDYTALIDHLPMDMEARDLITLWVHNGLLDAELNEKPALSVWRRYLR